MQIKLSNREKTMLYFLICFVLVVVGLYCLIIPSREKCNKLEETYEERSQMYTILNTNRNSLPDTQSQLQASIQQINTISDNFFAYLDTAELDENFTNMALKHNITVSSLVIDEATTQEVKPVLVQEGVVYGKADLCKLTITCKGTIDDMQMLLDEINADSRFNLQEILYLAGVGDDTSASAFSISVNAVCLSTVEGLEDTAQ